MQRRLIRLVVPLLVLAALLGLLFLWPGTADDRPWMSGGRLLLEALAIVTGGLTFIRLLDLCIWHGLLEHPSGRTPPRLLTDLVAGLVWAVVVVVVAGRLLDLPVAAILTTSGVAVAVAGFALRDTLASLVAGIALNVERPYEIGDWIEIDGHQPGRVVEIGWLTTRTVTRDGVCVVVPNSRLAMQPFRNYTRPSAAWRDQITITLDQAMAPERVERFLLAAALEVPEANAAGRAPDVKIKEFTELGTVWMLRYWTANTAAIQDIRYRLQRAVLRHLHQAGISLPYAKRDIYMAEMPTRNLDYGAHLDIVLERCPLLAGLEHEDLTHLAAHAQARRFPAGETIIRVGQPGSSLFVVVEGVVEVQEAQVGPPRAATPRYGPGAMFGEYALMTGQPRSASVMARTDVLVFEITKDDLQPVLTRRPELAASLATILAERQRSVDEDARKPKPAVEQNETSRLLERIRSVFRL